METIKEIIDLSDFKLDKEDYSSYEGFKIVTTEQTIAIGIDNRSGCCESWGHFASNDDTDDFIGAEIISVDVVDTALNKVTLEEHVGEYGVDGGGIMFVNLETTKGTLQFTVYNSHNGYYGHSAVLISKQKTVETTL